VLRQQFLYPVEIAFGRQKDATGTHDRLGNKSCDRFGPLARDQRLEV
jgi:hypothetical protein